MGPGLQPGPGHRASLRWRFPVAGSVGCPSAIALMLPRPNISFDCSAAITPPASAVKKAALLRAPIESASRRLPKVQAAPTPPICGTNFLRPPPQLIGIAAPRALWRPSHHSLRPSQPRQVSRRILSLALRSRAYRQTLTSAFGYISHAARYLRTKSTKPSYVPHPFSGLYCRYVSGFALSLFRPC